MTNKYLDFGGVLGYGWRTMKANLGFFIGLGFLWLIVTQIPTIIDTTAQLMKVPEAVYAVIWTSTTILSWIISIVVGIGIKKIALSFCDEQKPPIGTLFDAWDCFWRYLGTAILFGLIVLGGTLLLIIPGIIWSVKFGLCFYFVVEKGLHPIQALKASSRTTMGVKFELFGFGILCALINLAGILCCTVGLFATYPTVMVASALVYRQLMAQTPDLDEFGIVAPASQPPEESLPGE